MAKPSRTQTVAPADAEKFYAAGQFDQCSDVLKPKIYSIAGGQLQLLATCSFYAGDYRTTFTAAGRLKSNSPTRAQGLYWECKADQKLAIAALTRAGEIDSESPRMHVLLGDVFRQKRRWDEAEAEYRKAVSLDPSSRSARLSLAITLFTELKNDEAFTIDRTLLAEDADDPESNLLAGEILVQRNIYAEAEQYLAKCRKLPPEFLPRLHALLGQVYAVTDRISAAIQEYKQALFSWAACIRSWETEVRRRGHSENRAAFDSNGMAVQDSRFSRCLQTRVMSSQSASGRWEESKCEI